MAFPSLLLGLALALASLPASLALSEPWDIMFNDTSNPNNPNSLFKFRGQFNISMWFARKGANASLAYVKHVCNATTLGEPCNQPPYKHLETMVQFRWVIKNATAPLRTLNGSTPVEVHGKMCYTAYSYDSRPWRKKNKPYPRLTQNCPVDLGSGPYNTSGVFTHDLADDEIIPNALWFIMLWTKCSTPGNPNGDVSVCQFESTEAAPNTVETEQVMGITTGMIVACSILSAVGPLYFIAFWFADNWFWKKTGRGIKFIRDKNGKL